MAMRTTVLGANYEGLTISVGLAQKGHVVTTVDPNPGRARQLLRGKAIEGDTELLAQFKVVLREGNLKFATKPETSLTEADIVVIASIPGYENEGIADRAAILRAAEGLTGTMGSFKVVLVTAKVPVGSCRLLQEWIDDSIYGSAVSVVAFPALFSRPGALRDFLQPERIILGSDNDRSRRLLDKFFSGFVAENTSLCLVSWESAEMLKTTSGTLASSIPPPEIVPEKPPPIPQRT